MTELELFQRFGVALAIGALVGAERHWRNRDEEDGQRTAGLRTFTMIGMFGGAAGALELALRAGGRADGLIVVGLFVPFAAAFTLFHYREQMADRNFSVTTVIAAMLTYGLGALAVLGDLRLAGAAGVVLAGVLAARETLHRFIEAVTYPELRSAIVLLAMTFVILPLVPDDPIGPFGGVAPARIWTLAILVAAISFAGYVAVKLMGEAHGELVAGAVGGLLSSTAVTVANARRSSAEVSDASAASLAAGALGAGVVSYLRTGGLVIALAPALVWQVAPPLAVAALVMAGAAFLFARNDAGTHETSAPTNPFDLFKVLQLALLLAAIAFATRAAAQVFGDSGVIGVAAVTGLGDVDAPVITAAGLAGKGVSLETAAIAMLVAALSNTLAKAAYGIALGARRFGWLFGLGSLAAIGAGAATWLALRGFA
ncbi:MAG: DUF4010 domain-containing protein [Phreatobacter sp.]|uniref:MgtC/SapB family protein n=1 Tax=Phreatobacter sp. TaxID=1966341 RepID=UPI001A5B1EDE|nr:DUF4010 domain-containing protein [Phreatobacter sp.]MBL8571046.1 DUF4010 domain-containing protein [Phreatobacter sp.]